MNLGFYGTLLDPAVRAMVFGRLPGGCWRETGRPATLEGWGRFYVAGERYPGIRRRAGASIDVMVFSGVPPEALAAADAFEGAEYRREALNVRFSDAAGGTGTAMFYIPMPSVRLSGRAWRYDAAWRAQYRASFLVETRAAVAARRTVVRNRGPA